jgi:fatty-acid desaturase
MLLIGLEIFFIFVLIPYILSWLSFGLLNYLTHKEDKPRDVPLMNLLAPGEGWHKKHHDKPMANKIHFLDPAGIVIEKFFIRAKSSS